MNTKIIPYSRPIRVAYFVDIDEAHINHLVLDAIFYESYSKWAGASWLLVPFSNDAICDDRYLHWLEYYDPDIIYSYVTLDHNDIGSVCRRVMTLPQSGRLDGC